MKITYFLTLCAVMIFHSSPALSTPEETMIKGFVKWQTGRIEKIILDEAIRDITEDPYVDRFFTQTTNNIKIYGDTSSKRLIPIMQFYIEKDINAFKTITDVCVPYNINSWFVESDNINERSNNAKLLFNGLTKLASNANNAPRFTVNDFLDSVCAGADPDIKVTLNIPENRILAVTKEIIESLNSNDKKILQPLPDNINLFLSEDYLKGLIESIRVYQNIYADDEITNTIKAHQMLLLIEQFGGIKNDYTGFTKLKNVTIFFSELADASKTTPDAVVAVLDSYIGDKDTYMRKRIDRSYYSVVDVQEFNQENKTIYKTPYTSICTGPFLLPCSDSIFISSYYGISYTNTSKNTGEDKQWNFRAFGPVGIEMKLATFKSSPLTINYSPIDIGNYLTIELQGNDYSAKFEDILAPSLFFAYSLK